MEERLQQTYYTVTSTYILRQAARSLAFCAFLALSFMIVDPMNQPIPESPTTSRNAGNLMAHSRGGKYSCIWLDASKNGCGHRI